VVLYLADHEQRALIPLGPDGEGGEPLPIDTTVAGRAYRSDRLVGGEERDPGTDGSQLWVPVVDGAERLGVIGLVLDQPDELALRRCGILASLVAELLVTRNAYGDVLELVRRRQRMTLAAELRWSFLPPLTYIGRNVALSGMLEPAYEIAGDAFDYAVNADATHIAIFDAMGHGLEASMMASLAVAAYRHARRREVDLPALYDAIDEAIASQFDNERFVTGQMGRLTADGRLRWLAAGHPRPLLLRGSNMVGELECHPGLPMGLGGEPSAAADVQLEPGDRVLFYSDGMVEARSPKGELFGVERLSDLLERAAASEQPLPEICRRLVHSVLDHQSSTLSDDATVLLLEWAGPSVDGEPAPDGP
jgi:serine phosphatase RsbU (regulator of sigma subunit)